MSDMKSNYINGEWVTSSNGRENWNPSDLDSMVGVYAVADEQQTQDAIAAAQAAWPKWNAVGIEKRGTILTAIGDEIIARKEELGRLLSSEEGKPHAEGMGEVMRAGQFFQFYGAECLRQIGDFAQSTRPNVEADCRREPVGVVGIITPWNFPIAIAAWKAAPALAYGNSVVLKSADLVPASAWALTEIISRHGLPDGTFNLVMGRGSVVGETMITSPEVNAITFTGSDQTGRHIARAAAENLTKLQMEMGGKNPIVILDDADLDTAVASALNGAFFATGQRCTASSRMIVQEGIHDRFVAALTDKVKALNVGHALAEGTQLGPVVDEKQFATNMKYMDIGKSEANLVWGGEALDRETRGYYMAPALFTEANNQMRICREEIFGPIAAVIRVKDYDEALTTSNDTPFGLTSAIITSSLKYATDYKRNSVSGIVAVNLPSAGVDYHLAFGGRKGSSYGSREQGQYAKEFFSTVKTTYTNPL
jgi:alpha-ketoglutaric semialdehyde dehydrogenase